MACTVEAVTTNSPVAVTALRQSIAVCPFRQRLMVGSVEHRNLGYSRKKRPHGLNASPVNRVMERRQISTGFDGGDRILGDQSGIPDGLAAVNNQLSDVRGGTCQELTVRDNSEK